MISLFDVLFRDMLIPSRCNESLCDEQNCEEVKEKLPCKSDNAWVSDEDHYFLNVGLPNETSNLDVEVTNGYVNISYSTEVISDGKGYTHSYKSAGCMTYKLPQNINISTFKAKKENGYLFLTVEKEKTVSNSFKVEIE